MGKYSPIVKLGDLEVDTEKLAEFVVRAKKACWAGNAKGEDILRNGSRRFHFQEGKFEYTDTYYGYLRFAGNEKIISKSNQQLIWQMNYFGGMSGAFFDNEEATQETYKFLRKALSNVPIDIPFRGPQILLSEDKNWEYRCSSQGLNDIRNFDGCEKIFTKIPEWARGAYFGEYHGGIIIPKKK